jgi:hypothetical protein
MILQVHLILETSLCLFLEMILSQMMTNWNLIGNPYPCAIDVICAFYLKTIIEAGLGILLEHIDWRYLHCGASNGTYLLLDNRWILILLILVKTDYTAMNLVGITGGTGPPPPPGVVADYPFLLGKGFLCLIIMMVYQLHQLETLMIGEVYFNNDMRVAQGLLACNPFNDFLHEFKCKV